MIMKCTVCAKEMNIREADSFAECPSCGNLASLVQPVPKPFVITEEHNESELTITVDYRNRFLGFTLLFLIIIPMLVAIYYFRWHPGKPKFINEFYIMMREMPLLMIPSLVTSAIWPALAAYWGIALAVNRKILRLDSTCLYRYTKPLVTFSSKVPLGDINRYVIRKKATGAAGSGAYYELMAAMKKGGMKEIWPADNDPFMTLFIAEKIGEHLEGLGETPSDAAYLKFSRAVERGDADEVATLIDAHPELMRLRAKNGETALTGAIQKGLSPLVKLLVSSGAPVNKCESKRGRTPLHLAAGSGALEYVELLVAHGAEVNRRDIEGVTPLHYAQAGGHDAVIKILREQGGKETIGFTPKKPSPPWALYLPLLVPLIFFAILITSIGNDINTQARVGNLARVKHLVEGNPQLINRKSGKEELTPLHEAAERGKLEVVMYLVEKGANVNIKSRGDSTPLEKAARGGHAEVMEYLISKGASWDMKDRAGCSLLHYAAMSGNGDAVKLFLKKGFDVNERDMDGRTPLHHAIGCSSLGAAKELISEGADVKARDASKEETSGKTPLHNAYSEEAVRLLVRKGADVNARDARGRAPLHYAVQRWGGVAEELIVNGADVNARDSDGKTPLSLAKGSSYTTKVLKEHGGKE
jgi:ankyrin repeat protein